MGGKSEKNSQAWEILCEKDKKKKGINAFFVPIFWGYFYFSP